MTTRTPPLSSRETPRRMPRSSMVRTGISGSVTRAAMACRSVVVVLMGCSLKGGARVLAREHLHFRQQVAQVLGVLAAPAVAHRKGHGRDLEVRGVEHGGELGQPGLAQGGGADAGVAEFVVQVLVAEQLVDVGP